MFNRNTIIMSLALSLLAAISTFVYINQKEREILKYAEEKQVLIATKDILNNSIIDESMIKTSKIPLRFIQPGAKADENEVLGQITTAPIKKGEQILSTKLVRPGLESGLALRIPVGKRAVSILVDEVTGVANLIKPNDYVDVLSTFNFGDESKGKQYTFTILEGVQVLAVGQDLGDYTAYHHLQKGKKSLAGIDISAKESNQSKKTLTLSLLPEEAQKLVFSQESGSLTLILRPRFESDSKLNLSPSDANTVTGINELLKNQRRPVYREYRGN